MSQAKKFLEGKIDSTDFIESSRDYFDETLNRTTLIPELQSDSDLVEGLSGVLNLPDVEVADFGGTSVVWRPQEVRLGMHFKIDRDTSDDEIRRFISNQVKHEVDNAFGVSSDVKRGGSSLSRTDSPVTIEWDNEIPDIAQFIIEVTYTI